MVSTVTAAPPAPSSARVQYQVSPGTSAFFLSVVSDALLGACSLEAAVAKLERHALVVSSEAFFMGLDTALDVCTDVRLDAAVPLEDEGIVTFHRVEALRDAAQLK